uniref:Reverse transcriptase domain-containing protein n=1 Tax=Periophthalmus magnuspinnatus TaxID=409849 RepID=A0A3B4AWH2_9GOBI
KAGTIIENGNFSCSHCTKSFQTKRGLTQHMRMAHLQIYMSKLKLEPRGPEDVASVDQDLVARMKDLYDKELAPLEEPDSGLSEYMKRANMETLPSPKDVNREARKFVSQLRTVCSKPKKRNKTNRYSVLQKVWRANIKLAAEIILEGESDACEIPINDIEWFYKDLWSEKAKYMSLKGFGALPLAINEPLHMPMADIEVKQTLKKMRDSSPGPDGIRKLHLRLYDPSGSALTSMFNSWMASGVIPKVFKNSRTTLIGSSVILRLFSNLLAKRLSEACKVHPRQRGFIEGPGASENIIVLDGLIRVCKKNKKNVAVVFVDLARAFDTVPHGLIRDNLRRRQVCPRTVKLIMDAYEGCTTTIRSAGTNTSPIGVRVGVKQGDPLSPLLFNLALDPLLYALSENGVGLEFGNDQVVTAMAYADDLVLLSNSHEGMRTNLAILEAFSDRTGLAANPSKCSGFLLTKKGRKMTLNDNSQWTIKGKPIKWVNEGEKAKYLGVDIHPWKGVDSSRAKPLLSELLDKASKALLKPSQKVHLVITYILPRLQYFCDYANASNACLREMDSQIKGMIKKWLHLDHSTSDGILYSASVDGGLSIPRFEKLIPASRLKRFIKMINSGDPVTNEVARLIALEKHVAKLFREVTGLEAPANLDEVDMNLIATKAIKSRAFSRWTNQKSHGKGVLAFKGDKISNAWLRDPIKAGLSESEFISALQLRTNTFLTVKGKGPSPPATNCALCGYESGTLAHIVGNCNVLKEIRMANHNKICQKLACLAHEKGWKVWSEKRLFVEGKMGVPDLIIHKGDVAHVIDVAICFEQSPTTLESVAGMKSVKYKPFRGAVRTWLGVKMVTTRGFPVGARGKWYKPNDYLLSDMGLSVTRTLKAARAFAKIALCGSIRTCRAYKKELLNC